MILKPHVLDYWRSFQPGIGLEEKHFIDTVEPHFNRLTVFDPRFPHGVRPVGGTRDPLKGRLVSAAEIYIQRWNIMLVHDHVDDRWAVRSVLLRVSSVLT